MLTSLKNNNEKKKQKRSLTKINNYKRINHSDGWAPGNGQWALWLIECFVKYEFQPSICFASGHKSFNQMIIEYIQCKHCKQLCLSLYRAFNM